MDWSGLFSKIRNLLSLSFTIDGVTYNEYQSGKCSDDWVDQTEQNNYQQILKNSMFFSYFCLRCPQTPIHRRRHCRQFSCLYHCPRRVISILNHNFVNFIRLKILQYLHAVPIFTWQKSEQILAQDCRRIVQWEKEANRKLFSQILYLRCYCIFETKIFVCKANLFCAIWEKFKPGQASPKGH